MPEIALSNIPLPTSSIPLSGRTVLAMLGYVNVGVCVKILIAFLQNASMGTHIHYPKVCTQSAHTRCLQIFCELYIYHLQFCRFIYHQLRLPLPSSMNITPWKRTLDHGAVWDRGPMSHPLTLLAGSTGTSSPALTHVLQVRRIHSHVP